MDELVELKRCWTSAPRQVQDTVVQKLRDKVVQKSRKQGSPGTTTHAIPGTTKHASSGPKNCMVVQKIQNDRRSPGTTKHTAWSRNHRGEFPDLRDVQALLSDAGRDQGVDLAVTEHPQHFLLLPLAQALDFPTTWAWAWARAPLAFEHSTGQERGRRHERWGVDGD